MREHEIEAAAVDLELGPELLLCHHRALDVPARPAEAPRRLPRRVLAGLRRLPESEVPGILLERVRSLLLVRHLVGPLAGQPAIAGIARHAKVDVALDRVGAATGDELLDERDRKS